ncbi:MAG TPA: ATP-dependent DNA helicase RecG [Candidatus Paceibacterota bacterium]|nr:ATP-dependent DNA helicase RecG [Candidatus Paceibacterota bacterium]
MNLSHSLEEHFRLQSTIRAALSRIGIRTIEDLLYHFPGRYGDTAESRNIATLRKGDTALIFGSVSKLRTSKGFRTKIAMADGVIDDGTGKIKAIWFNQPYLAKMIPDGALVRVEGKVSQKRAKTGGEGDLYLSNPKIEQVTEIPTAVGDSLFGSGSDAHTLYPIYPETRGLSSEWIYHKIQAIFKSGILEAIEDPLPEDMLKRYNLPTLRTALVWIHTPENADHAAAARKRFAFEEVFFIQLERQRERKAWQKNPAFVIDPKQEAMDRFVSRFPFPLTDAQKKSTADIMADFKKGHAMARLLEGDVGSGKTAVAATTTFAAINTRPLSDKKDAAGLQKRQDYGSLQVAYMAPTEILAAQHFESFIQYFEHTGISVALITGSGCRKFPAKVPSFKNGERQNWTDISRAQLLKWVANGEIPILIGTHALIQKSVKFKNLAYAVVDEQHRFGTAQRAKLVRKDGIQPHLLSMTATPIPRTLALTIYGDLDISILDAMPHGRKPIITQIVVPAKSVKVKNKDGAEVLEREEAYEKIRAQLREGRQAYVICPRIDEPDPTKESAVQAKSVKEEAKRLQDKVFPEYEIDILHSKMKDDEKERVMLEFKRGSIHILVATSVVEVGVNVPNATVILIEGAERFGLAQLHQLRGRVVRSNHQAYCFVLAETQSEKTIDRLTALTTAKNGFELAEFDLKFRGSGELYGRKQWGVSDVAMEAIQNIKMVEAARTEALRLASEDESLARHPLIASELSRREKQRIHFE